MKLKSLLIACAITLSPALQAGPGKWFKDNAVPLAIGIAGVSAVVIFMSQDDDKEEAVSNSPTNEYPSLNGRSMLDAARKQATQRTSRTKTMDNGDMVTKESDTKTVILFHPNSILPKRTLMRDAKPIKSSLRSKDYKPADASLTAQISDTAFFKEALSVAIEEDRANVSKGISESSIQTLCANNRQICKLHHAQSLWFEKHPEVTFARRIEWAQELLAEL